MLGRPQKSRMRQPQEEVLLWKLGVKNLVLTTVRCEVSQHPSVMLRRSRSRNVQCDWHGANSIVSECCSVNGNGLSWPRTSKSYGLLSVSKKENTNLKLTSDRVVRAAIPNSESNIISANTTIRRHNCRSNSSVTVCHEIWIIRTVWLDTPLINQRLVSVSRGRSRSIKYNTSKCLIKERKL